MTPQFTDRFIDSVQQVAPQTEMGKAVAGESATTDIAKALEDYRRQPMSLKAAQEIDEALTKRITREYTIKGMTKEGRDLSELQSQFRDQVLNAEPGDVVGATDGFDALRTGRQAWAAAMKLRDLEAIQQRAEITEQPSTSIRTQIRTHLGQREEIARLHR